MRIIFSKRFIFDVWLGCKYDWCSIDSSWRYVWSKCFHSKCFSQIWNVFSKIFYLGHFQNFYVNQRVLRLLWKSDPDLDMPKLTWLHPSKTLRLVHIVYFLRCAMCENVRKCAKIIIIHSSLLQIWKIKEACHFNVWE